MGHDIYGYNRNGKEIAYARFFMSNPSASTLYYILGAEEYNGGVSGIGAKEKFSLEQMEKAKNKLLQFYDVEDLSELKIRSLDMDDEQILNFLSNCLKTAKEEDDVEIVFL